MRAEFPNSEQGDGYAMDLWRERHRDLETLESERLDMCASDYQSSRRSLVQAIEELETLLPPPLARARQSPCGCSDFVTNSTGLVGAGWDRARLP